jgi:hypothetical protein
MWQKGPPDPDQTDDATMPTLKICPIVNLWIDPSPSPPSWVFALPRDTPASMTSLIPLFHRLNEIRIMSKIGNLCILVILGRFAGFAGCDYFIDQSGACFNDWQAAI